MITVRTAGERGHTDWGWLDSHHSFSFGDYHDPDHMGFGYLRVINDDRVAPGGGFGTHPHADMEIFSWVLEGELGHRDSLGHVSTVRPGEIQRISAGTGITHSEFNRSPLDAVRFLQIWLLPRWRGLKPSYEQKAFTEDELAGRLRLIASPDGRDGSTTIQQDADVYAARLAPGGAVSHALKPGHSAWVQVARGAVTLNGRPLAEGDGAAVSGEKALEVRADAPAEVLLFDMG